METLANKTINYPVNGFFKCEVILSKRWNGRFMVEVRDYESSLFTNAMQKSFMVESDARTFFESKVKELTPDA